MYKRQRQKRLEVDGEEVKLTPIEYKITELLMRHPGRVFPIDEIYERVWNEPSFAPENTVAVHIRRIRAVSYTHLLWVPADRPRQSVPADRSRRWDLLRQSVLWVLADRPR